VSEQTIKELTRSVCCPPAEDDERKHIYRLIDTYGNLAGEFPSETKAKEAARELRSGFPVIVGWHRRRDGGWWRGGAIKRGLTRIRVRWHETGIRCEAEA